MGRGINSAQAAGVGVKADWSVSGDTQMEPGQAIEGLVDRDPAFGFSCLWGSHQASCCTDSRMASVGAG